MHPGQIPVDTALVRRLMDSQFPEWAHLPVEPVSSTGTVNALYRLGDGMVARLPLLAEWADGAAKVQRWLPRLAPHLPLAVPLPVAAGEPSDEYPLPWSVYDWLQGGTAAPELIVDPADAARRLAEFIAALRGLDPTSGPPPVASGLARGLSLTLCDRSTRAAIEQLSGDFDTRELTASWDAALATPEWDRPAAWLHGDLYSANLLATDGLITGVIDWEGMAVGDPAADLTVAWDLFDAETRAVFRYAVGVDEATWARGRGWALTMGLMALPYYRESNPEFAQLARRLIENVLEDSR